MWLKWLSHFIIFHYFIINGLQCKATNAIFILNILHVSIAGLMITQKDNSAQSGACGLFALK